VYSVTRTWRRVANGWHCARVREGKGVDKEADDRGRQIRPWRSTTVDVLFLLYSIPSPLPPSQVQRCVSKTSLLKNLSLPALDDRRISSPLSLYGHYFLLLLQGTSTVPDEIGASTKRRDIDSVIREPSSWQFVLQPRKHPGDSIFVR